MSNETDPNQSPSPAKSESEVPKSQDTAAKDAAAKALGQAKESLEAFKKLDVQTQVYLAGLAVTVLCSFIFSVIKLSVKMDGPMADLMKDHMPSMPSLTVFEAGWKGKLAVLAAIAGIGLWVWNFIAAKKEGWIQNSEKVRVDASMSNYMEAKRTVWLPLALAGCAGLSALLLLVLWMRSGTSSVDAPGMKVSASMTLLGFWLPLAGAIAATVVSVKRILNPVPPPAA